MNSSDQLKIDIIEKLKAKKINLETAINVLNVSVRTIARYIKGFSESGVIYFQDQQFHLALPRFRQVSCTFPSLPINIK